MSTEHNIKCEEIQGKFRLADPIKVFHIVADYIGDDWKKMALALDLSIKEESFSSEPIKEDVFSILKSWYKNSNDDGIIDAIVQLLGALDRNDIIYIIEKECLKRKVPPDNEDFGKEENGQMEPTFQLMKNKKARELKYWQFIDFVVPDGPVPLNGWKNHHVKELYCRKCNLKFTFKLGSSQAVRRHMKNNHMEDLAHFVENQIKEDEIDKRTLDDLFLNSVPFKKIKNSFEADKEYLTRLLVRWICKSNRPMCIVEDQGFRDILKFVNKLQRPIEVPGRKSVTEMITEMAERMRCQLKHKISEEMDYYCLTTDMWSSRALNSFISLTIHYLTKEFEMRSWTLEVRNFSGKRSAERICDQLEQFFKEWSLSKQHLTVIIRDNASNAVKATDLLGLPCLGCVLHSIHLVLCSLLYNKTIGKTVINEVKDEEDDEWNLPTLTADAWQLEYLEQHSESDKKLLKMLSCKMEVFRSLAKFFHTSPKAYAKLCSLQGSNAVGTIVDCETRWSSTYDMLTRLMRLRYELQEFLTWVKTPAGKNEFHDFNIHTPTDDDWFIVQAMILLLRPFKNVTDVLSGEKYSTLALAFPCLRMIQRKLSTSAIFDELKQLSGAQKICDNTHALVDKIRLVVLRYFMKRFSSIPEEFAYSSILHPNLSKMKYLSFEEKQAARAFIIKEMMASTTNNVMSSIPSIHMNDQTYSLNVYHDIFGLNSDSDEGSPKDFLADTTSNSFKKECNDELNAYLEMARLHADDHSKIKCPFSWWKENRRSLKRLAPIARKWLGCLSTSAPSERAFSVGGNLVTARRAALRASIIRDIIFLHNNLGKA